MENHKYKDMPQSPIVLVGYRNQHQENDTDFIVEILQAMLKAMSKELGKGKVDPKRPR